MRSGELATELGVLEFSYGVSLVKTLEKRYLRRFLGLLVNHGSDTPVEKSSFIWVVKTIQKVITV